MNTCTISELNATLGELPTVHIVEICRARHSTARQHSTSVHASDFNQPATTNPYTLQGQLRNICTCCGSASPARHTSHSSRMRSVMCTPCGAQARVGKASIETAGCAAQKKT